MVFLVGRFVAVGCFVWFVSSWLGFHTGCSAGN